MTVEAKGGRERSHTHNHTETETEINRDRERGGGVGGLTDCVENGMWVEGKESRSKCRLLSLNVLIITPLKSYKD